MQQIGTGPIGERWLSASAAITGERQLGRKRHAAFKDEHGDRGKDRSFAYGRGHERDDDAPPVEPQAKDSAPFRTS